MEPVPPHVQRLCVGRKETALQKFEQRSPCPVLANAQKQHVEKVPEDYVPVKAGHKGNRRKGSVPVVMKPVFVAFQRQAPTCGVPHVTVEERFQLFVGHAIRASPVGVVVALISHRLPYVLGITFYATKNASQRGRTGHERLPSHARANATAGRRDWRPHASGKLLQAPCTKVHDCVHCLVVPRGILPVQARGNDRDDVADIDREARVPQRVPRNHKNLFFLGSRSLIAMKPNGDGTCQVRSRGVAQVGVCLEPRFFSHALPKLCVIVAVGQEFALPGGDHGSKHLVDGHTRPSDHTPLAAFVPNR